ncbi:MAG: hypothetical protein R2941_13990 [Desulfobacterales bacterium]
MAYRLYQCCSFCHRYIETQTRDRVARQYRLEQETDALIQEAILGNIPMEIMTMQRLAENPAQGIICFILPFLPGLSDPPVFLKSFSGNTAGLVSDFRFICQGLTEFSRKRDPGGMRSVFFKNLPEYQQYGGNG